MDSVAGSSSTGTGETLSSDHDNGTCRAQSSRCGIYRDHVALTVSQVALSCQLDTY
jgi:hypothetical protein